MPVFLAGRLIITLPAPRHSEGFPVDLADRCVQCGLCLPHCPTYRLTADENESPRGRIALMRALAAGNLPANARLARHLEQCLACRACERVCPSQVPYGQLIHAGRTLLTRHRGARRLRFWLRDTLLTRPRRLRRLARLLRFFQRSGVLSLLRASRVLDVLGLAPAARLLPPLPPPSTWRPHYPAVGLRRGAVDLFHGCIGPTLDGASLEAALRLLTRLGYDVHLAPTQTCCGAMDRHDGDPAGAAQLARANIAAYAGNDRPIVALASACCASLMDVGRDLGGDAAAAAFSARVVDLLEFLAGVTWPTALEFAPLPATIAVHEPCSQRNALRNADRTYRLLERLPQAKVVALADNAWCCGGAGTYPLTQPALAARLLDAKLGHVASLRPDYLVTTNIGCALHIQAGLRAAGLATELLHPVTLIERALRPAQPERLAGARASAKLGA